MDGTPPEDRKTKVGGGGKSRNGLRPGEEQQFFQPVGWGGEG